MSHRKIIAITGLKRSGKDTLADYIVEKYGFTKVKIADPLKDICKQLFGLTDSQVETDEKEVVDANWGVTPRQILQFVGTEMFQWKLQELMPDIGRAFWMRQLLQTHTNDNIVISDMRFVHEYNILKAAQPDLIVVRLIRDGQTCNADQHSSEKEWDQIPASIIVNNISTMSVLYAEFEKQFVTNH